MAADIGQTLLDQPLQRALAFNVGAQPMTVANYVRGVAKLTDAAVESQVSLIEARGRPATGRMTALSTLNGHAAAAYRAQTQLDGAGEFPSAWAAWVPTFEARADTHALDHEQHGTGARRALVEMSEQCTSGGDDSAARGVYGAIMQEMTRFR
jgi:hypothetical protein